VVDLGDEGPAVVREPFDDPGLPQRSTTIELLRHEPAHQVLQLRLSAGRRQRRAADVVVEDEGGIVDPRGVREATGDEPQPLAVAGQERELALDQCEDVVERRRGTGEDRTRADVEVGDAVLGVDEDGVERTEVIHWSLL
jgi:hypothetical protein